MSLLSFVYIKAATRPVVIRIGSAGCSNTPKPQSGLVATQSTRYRFLRWVPACFDLQGEDRFVFSGQPGVDCTSWNVSQLRYCYSLFRFVKVNSRQIDLQGEGRLVAGEQPKPLHPVDCVAHSHLAGIVKFLSRNVFDAFRASVPVDVGGIDYQGAFLKPLPLCLESLPP